MRTPVVLAEAQRNVEHLNNSLSRLLDTNDNNIRKVGRYKYEVDSDECE